MARGHCSGRGSCVSGEGENGGGGARGRAQRAQGLARLRRHVHEDGDWGVVQRRSVSKVGGVRVRTSERKHAPLPRNTDSGAGCPSSDATRS